MGNQSIQTFLMNAKNPKMNCLVIIYDIIPGLRNAFDPERCSHHFLRTVRSLLLKCEATVKRWMVAWNLTCDYWSKLSSYQILSVVPGNLFLQIDDMHIMTTIVPHTARCSSSAEAVVYWRYIIPLVERSSWRTKAQITSPRNKFLKNDLLDCNPRRCSWRHWYCCGVCDLCVLTIKIIQRINKIIIF